MTSSPNEESSRTSEPDERKARKREQSSSANPTEDSTNESQANESQANESQADEHETGSGFHVQAGYSHLSVLLGESIDLLNVRPNLTYVDATAGAGGHLQEILNRATSNIRTDEERSPARQESEQQFGFSSEESESAGRIIAIDRDLDSLEKLKTRFGADVAFAHANFSEIETVVRGLGIDTVSGGIIADLGVSSMQIDDPDRGFSFMRDGPLDMRMDTEQTLTADFLINNSSERQLAEIIFKFGEERYSRRIARAIVETRPLHTTLQLAAVVSRCVKRAAARHGSQRESLHPATRTFQAIRIAVNNEMQSLETFLRSSIKLLAPGARLVVITFHSLEDRLVKQVFKEAATGCICPPRQPVCTCHHKAELLIITRKPVIASEKEVLANTRSRSAKLRAGEKVT